MGTRPATRPDVWPDHQGIGQQWGEGMGHGQGPPRQRNQEWPENLGAPAGANNAGAVPQGPPAHQGAAVNQPGGQAGIANAPPIGGTKATPPRSGQVSHRHSLNYTQLLQMRVRPATYDGSGKQRGRQQSSPHGRLKPLPFPISNSSPLCSRGRRLSYWATLWPRFTPRLRI